MLFGKSNWKNGFYSRFVIPDTKKRIASIDCGSNTFLLLIADYFNGFLYPVQQASRIVALQRDMDENGNLSDSALERAGQTLLEYCKLSVERDVESIWACGTSALRSATNGAEFCRKLKEQTGISVEIISGEDEAQYGYFGAVQDLPQQYDNMAFIDVGGGSTEFSWGTRKTLVGSTSLPLGSIKLTRQFLGSNPVTTEEIDSVIAAIDAELVKLPAFSGGNMGLLGVAATPITLALMHIKGDKNDFDATDGYVLTLAAIEEICCAIQFLPLNERKKLPGLHPDRADVILPGGLIIQQFMKRAGFDALHISLRGLRFGYALAKIEGGGN